MKLWEFWNWTRYAKPVEIIGTRPVPDCEAALARMTQPNLSSLRRSAKPFAGWVRGNAGRLRYARRGPFQSYPRALQFTLRDRDGGCVLVGELEVVLPIRIFVSVYFVLCIAMTVWEVYESLTHGGSWLYQVRQIMESLVFTLVFMFGYSGLCVLVGRRAERQGLKIISHVLRNETAEPLIVDLLS